MTATRPGAPPVVAYYTRRRRRYRAPGTNVRHRGMQGAPTGDSGESPSPLFSNCSGVVQAGIRDGRGGRTSWAATMKQSAPTKVPTLTSAAFVTSPDPGTT